MRLQGWYRDPFGNHHERWFSDGQPTKLVRDRDTGSLDEPPQAGPAHDRRPPWAGTEWRWWTVCLPALLALAVSGLFLVFAGLASAMNCFDGCSPVTEGMPVGVAGEIAVAIAAVVLLVIGLNMQAWRPAIVAALWMAVALGSGSAVLIATARPANFVAPAAQASAPAVATPSLDVAACKAIGGWVLYSNYLCYSVPFVGADGERYFGSVGYGADGRLIGPTDTSGMGATRSECESGTYLGPTGTVTGTPGRWDAPLSLCLPPTP